MSGDGADSHPTFATRPPANCLGIALQATMSSDLQ